MTLPLLIRSHHGDLSRPFAAMIAEGRLSARWEWAVEREHIASAAGILTTMHLDQIRALGWRDAFACLLDRGGRVLVNGHVAKPFIAGLEPFIPLASRSRADLTIHLLADHPVFAGLDRLAWRTSRGVAGFYGRGHNPMPEGGIALTGIGPDRRPIDWVWHRPRGGSVFSHAGNDLWGMSDHAGLAAQVAVNAVAWTAGEFAR
jgi:hypothetical protein